MNTTTHKRRGNASSEPQRTLDESRWQSNDSKALGALVHSARRIIAELDEVLQPYGITYTRFGVLALLTNSPHSPLSMTELSTITVIHPPNMTKIVGWLVEKGFARRVSDPGDRRVVHVEVTPSGLQLVDSAAEAIFATRFGMKRLEPLKVQTLTRLLDDLRPTV